MGTRKTATEITKQLFDKFDTSKDGKLTLKELKIGLSQYGNPTSSELDALYLEMGVKLGQPVTIEQFGKCIEFYVNKKKNATMKEEEDALRKSFKIFDKDGNGWIDRGELRKVLTELGDKMTETEVDEMFKAGDIDNDGKIKTEEFVRMFTNGLPNTTKTPTVSTKK